jgi:23S rRNA (cytidine1920-2'-O)/16S rRNA (cytidine1409-2'-O)-methyltransferase
MAKQRIDQLLVSRGLAESRARAQALVMAGLVYAGDRKVEKSGQQVAEDADISVKGRDHPWVSRGGVKLAYALEHFALDPAGAVAMDIGSSTGGFTDVLLANGAAHVFAVDSGTNQLAWKLRQDPRVTVLEQTSARLLTWGCSSIQPALLRTSPAATKHVPAEVELTVDPSPARAMSARSVLQAQISPVITPW